MLTSQRSARLFRRGRSRRPTSAACARRLSPISRSRLNTSPSEPEWLDLDDILETHAEQIERFGGADGVRDLALVQSALARPRQLYHYEGESDALILAVRLGVGLALNHGFVDGNKRTGFVAMLLFLGINGYALAMPGDTTPGVLFEAVAKGAISEDQLIEDFYPYVQPLEL